MKLRTVLGWSSALCLGAGLLQAQETNEIEQLRKQLKEATEAYQKAAEQYRQTIDALNRRLEAVQPAPRATAAGPAQPTNPPPALVQPAA